MDTKSISIVKYRFPVKCVCLGCSKEFEIPRYKFNQGRGRYCSRECYKPRVQIFKKQCRICQKQFESKREDAIVCSMKCAGENRKVERAVLSCSECGKEIIKRISEVLKNNFCSYSCSASFINKSRSKEIDIVCIGCGIIKKYNVYKENSSIIDKYCSHPCYVNHQKERLDSKCRENAIKYAEYNSGLQKERFKNKENHPFFGKHHTKETCDKISKIHTGMHLGDKNPMFGKHHSEETCAKMSDIVSQQYISGKRTVKNTAYEQGLFLSKKTSKEIFYRSSWELAYLEYLDKEGNKSVEFSTDWLRIPYYNTEDHLRYYVPDVLVKYKDGHSEVIEIKPSCYLKYKINQLKFAAARKYCKENNLKFRVLTEKYLRHIGCDI